jgi:gliding motility-associated-like protein
LNKPVFYIILVCFVFIFNARTQNLISNPSFEEIDSCYGQPAGTGFDVFAWSNCIGWKCPTYGSSDLWCDNPVFGGTAPPVISAMGYQYPRTGHSMSGLFPFVSHEEYREYIQNKLTKPLEKDTYYHFSMYVSNADYQENLSSCTSCMQVYFSAQEVSQPLSYLPLPVLPQIKNDPFNYYIDTLNWILFEGTYKAQGGERYVTIGCFETDLTIPLTVNVTDSTGSSIYFFVDDVALIEIPSEISFPNVFTPNGDEINDFYFPTIINIPNYEITILNRWGNVMTVLTADNPSWDGKINNAWASEGVYYYHLKSPNKIYEKHGFFHLVR